MPASHHRVKVSCGFKAWGFFAALLCSVLALILYGAVRVRAIMAEYNSARVLGTYQNVVMEFGEPTSWHRVASLWAEGACRPVTSVEFTSLRAGNCTNATLRLLGNFASLERLSVLSPECDDSGVEWLAGLKNLTDLRIMRARRLTDRACRTIGTLTNLRTLDIAGAPVSDAGISYLDALSELTSFSAESPRITDRSAELLSRHRRLKELDLTGCAITDDGVAAIATIPGIEVLCLNGTRVTDGCYQLLMKLSNLRRLEIVGTSVTQVATEEFQIARPQVVVAWR